MRRKGAYLILPLLVACGGTGPSVPTFIVGYELKKTNPSSLQCDSVKYENAQGAIIKVDNPTLPWSVAFSAPSGSHIQVSAYMVAFGGGQGANLKMTWTLNGVSSESDSSFAMSTAAGAFTLSLARRKLLN